MLLVYDVEATGGAKFELVKTDGPKWSNYLMTQMESDATIGEANCHLQMSEAVVLRHTGQKMR